MGEKMHLVNWLVKDSKLCYGLCQENEANLHVVWLLVWNMLKPHLRQAFSSSGISSSITEFSSKVSDIIIASLLVDGTAVPRKVARLHLICDILHNSAASVPSAWKFRQEFQSRLGIVFDHLATIYHSFPGRITAETFKKQITSVVDIWEDWIVFSPDFTADLRARLDGAVAMDVQPENKETAGSKVEESPQVFASRFKASSFQPAKAIVEPTVPGPEYGEPMDQDSDGLDGEPIEGDVDGEPLDDDVDGEPMEDGGLDGEPMGDGDLDGEPLDDDIDGIPTDS